MLLQVPGGTPKGDAKSLCLTCRNATIVTGTTKMLIDCEVLGSDNTKELVKIQPVHRCSGYDDKSMPSLTHMKDVAWELKPNKKTGKLGFQQPASKYIAIEDPFSGKETW
jgi:hypothetical protein